MKKEGVSDLTLKVEEALIIRKNRELLRLEDHDILTEEDIKGVASSVMSRIQLEQFERNKEMDLAVNVPVLGVGPQPRETLNPLRNTW